MAIVANDFTLGYFNFSSGLTAPFSFDLCAAPASEIASVQSISVTGNQPKDDGGKEQVDDEWITDNPTIPWN